MDGLLITVEKYESVWNKSKSVDQQRWSPNHVLINIQKEFNLNEGDYRRTLENLMTVKSLKLHYMQYKPSGKGFTVSLFSCLHNLQLRNLNIHFDCHMGLEFYSINSVTEFIESQAALETLEIRHGRTSFDPEKLRALGLAMNSVKHLKTLKITFINCPDISEPRMKNTIHEIDSMPILESIFILLKGCEKIGVKAGDDLKSLIMAKMFPSLRNVKVVTRSHE